MNSYLKVFLAASACVAFVGVCMQHVISPQYSMILQENPRLRAIIQSLHDLIPVQRLIFPVFKYFNPSPASTVTKKKKKKKERLFTNDKLREYDGRHEGKGPYLAVLGRVYDVRKGMQHYGPGGGYEFFSGRDASRAFVSGDFSEAGLIDDITGLSGTDYIGLDEWVKFYDKDYKYVGKLIGRYYNERGEPTPYYYQAQRWISEAHIKKETDSKEKKVFPPCNTEWHPDAGSRFWCTRRSGGIERDWVGVPRKLFLPGHSQPRCACVRDSGPPSHDPTRHSHNNRGDLDHPNLQEYPGCDPDLPECTVKID